MWWDMSRAFLGESKNRIVISDHMDSSLPKQGKIRKRIIYHDNGMTYSALPDKKNRGKKKQQQTA